MGMQCMQAGPLVRVTRVWQRQRMIEGISGTKRLLQVPERASKNNAGTFMLICRASMRKYIVCAFAHRHV